MKTGDTIDKPWGWERILELNDRYCIKHLFIKPGHRLSKQYHERKIETLLLASGAVTLSIWDGDQERAINMTPSVPHHIERGLVHRMTGAGSEGGLVLEVSTPELEDVVRLQDDYGRRPNVAV